MYTKTLQYFGGDESHGWAFDPWQHEAIFQIIKHQYVCINRCRSGSKTRDLSALAVFFRLRGLIPLWYAANRKQLVRAQVYWNENCFCIARPVTINRNFVHLQNGTDFQIAVLKKGLQNDRGPRAHAIFYDEVSQIDMDLIDNTRLITAGMDFDGSKLYWIHFSTPEINTAFQVCCEEFHTIVNDCRYPSWFSAEYIKKVKDTLPKPKFQQEMLCMFISMAGCVFDGHLFRGHCPDPLTQYIYYGHDPNAREGYCLVGKRFTANFKKSEVVFVHNFGPGALGKKLLLEFLYEEYNERRAAAIEMETNGVGMPIFDDFCAMIEQISRENIQIIGSFWNHVDKIRRINYMNKCNMYIPTENGKEFQALWNQLNSVSLTEAGDKIDKPSDKPWHFADSDMHAHIGQGIVWA